MKYRDEYIEAGGGFCPYCHSDEIEEEDIYYDSGSRDYRIGCLSCSRKWWEHYTLEEIIKIEDE
jgi:hypothetical protein